MSLCKRKYMRISDPEAEKKLDALIQYCEDQNFSHVAIVSERKERDDHFVVVQVDIKVSQTEKDRKKFTSIEDVKK